MNESVRLVNKGDEDWVGGYSRQQYVVPVNGEAVVPWDAACLWFGDPRASDVGQNKARIGEYERLCVKYGVYEKAEEFEDARPKIEVFRFNGERVKMLAEDPFGTPVDVFGSGDPAYNDPTVQIAKLTEMVNDLQKQVSSGSGTADELDQAFQTEGEPAIPEDEDEGDEISTGVGMPMWGDPNMKTQPDGGSQDGQQ